MAGDMVSFSTDLLTSLRDCDLQQVKIQLTFLILENSTSVSGVYMCVRVHAHVKNLTNAYIPP